MTAPVLGKPPAPFATGAEPCVGSGVDFFDWQQEAEAVALCAGCPSRAACLAYAMSAPVERCGVWGGLTPDERGVRSARFRRRRAKARAS